MKIIHVILGKANPNRMNGVNKVVYELASIQTKQKYDTEVWGLSNSQNDDIKRPFSLKIFKRNKYCLSHEIETTIKSLDINNLIFHIHGAFIFDFYLITKLLVKNNIKYIYTSHGAFNKVAMNKNWLIKYFYFYCLEKFIIKNATKIHLIAESEYNHFNSLYKTNNKVLIPNGINIDGLEFKYEKIEKSKDLTLCFCGRIDIKTKGLDLLIDGFEAFIKEGNSAMLWIIGDGDELNTLKSMVKDKKLEKNIKFFGARFGEEKLNLIANSDLFILTSRNDVFPTSVLEAAGIGVPLLVSKETNYGPYVEKFKCGLVLDKNNSKEISDSIKKFKSYSNNELINMKENSKKMIMDSFNIEKISNLLLNEKGV